MLTISLSCCCCGCGCEVRVEDMVRVVEGQQSEIFQRNKTKEHPKHLSFSLYYRLPDSNKEVTLDVVCRVSRSFGCSLFEDHLT